MPPVAPMMPMCMGLPMCSLSDACLAVRRDETIRCEVFIRQAVWGRCRVAAVGSTGGRRERLRVQTTAEIQQVALRLMASGGPDAITLRAIAREMGMTANAIYGYFATRDDLV